MSAWSVADIGDQHGRTVVITGANAGIGFETARTLAARGAAVVLACRDEAAAEAAAKQIDGVVSTCVLDLASLASVRAAAARIRDEYPRLDLLINNAGVMMTPAGTTADGFELQLGTNHLGHFAFTGLLLELLVDVPGSRVVTVCSSARHAGRVELDDLHFRQRKYSPIAAYSQSKLANLMFSQQLQQHLSAIGAPTISVGMEPGLTPTRLSRHMPLPVRWISGIAGRFVGQPDIAAGARILLRASTDPQTKGGDYYAPDGKPPYRAKGEPVLLDPQPIDAEVQRALWSLSQELTGVDYGPTPDSQEETHPAEGA